ncbi:MAG: PAS domain S-box protein [Balneolaceae bacterium]|nr:PAS domain S-box protein [Balneolaceae bacterium]
MKESTSRTENKERVLETEFTEAEVVSPLRLINPGKQSVSEKKRAMADKIWDDLINNFSFMGSESDTNNGLEIIGKKYLIDEPVKKELILEDGMLSIQQNNEAITDEHLKFTKAVQLSQSFVLVINQDGVIEYANPHFQKVSGFTQDELIGKELGYLISDLASHEEHEQILQSIKAGVSWKGELVNIKKNGEWYIFTAKVSPVSINSGSAVDFIIVGHDITSFRETEIKLEQAVQEKSILLSELHHRVKNNLAIISGIMQLQAFDEGDEEVKTKLFSGVGRVKTLATMHELLYESSSFTMLEFGKNICKIVNTVASMFESQESKLKVNYNLEPILLNINQAHPCALILNEVITNSYKKAAKLVEKAPELNIKLVCYGKKVMIELKDNIGSLPEGYTSDKQPLSFQLIKTLVRQLNGKYNYLTDDFGTLFTLAFDKEHLKGTGNARLS